MNKIVVVCISLILSVPFSAKSQNRGNPSRAFSPYSAYGLGYLSSDFYSWNFGMANVGIAHYDESVANMKNPSLLSFNKSTILDINLGYRQDYLSIDTTLKYQSAAGINSLNFVMPISYTWTTAFSLTPVSDKATSSTSSYLVPGTTQSILQSDTSFGGVQKASWSNGIAVAKGFRLGVGLDYTFGNLTDRVRTQLDSGGTNLIEERLETSIRGLEYTIGAFYQNKVVYVHADPTYIPKKDTLIYLRKGDKKWPMSAEKLRKLQTDAVDFRYDTIIKTEGGNKDRTLQFSIGATYGAPAIWQETGVRSITWITNEFGAVGYDTTTSSPNRTSRMGVGFAVGNTSMIGRWTLAGDVEMTNWSKYSPEGGTPTLADASRMSLGFQYTPEIQAPQGFFKMVTYSVGVYQYHTPYMYSGQQLDEFGMHFGMSFVDRAKRANESFRWMEATDKRINTLSRYNVGMAIGKLGYNNDQAIQQMFIKVNLGISLNSEWFLRRKIN